MSSDAARSKSKSRTSETLRVLIVDDEKHVLVVLERMFDMFAKQSGLKLELTKVTDSADALHFLLKRGKKRDVIFSDVRMPKLTGVDIYNSIKGVKPELLERFVFVTAYSGDLLQELPGEKPHVLNKPFNYNQFSEKLNGLLSTQS